MSFAHKEIPKVYKSADLFTFPTNPDESFGIAMVEAMATGLPVVVNNDPIRREIVGDAGVFVEVTDTVSYVNALRYALEKKWGGKPLKQAKRFDWDRVVKRYEQLFKDLGK